MTVERLTELLAIPMDELTKEDKTELIEYYKFVYGFKTCASCKDKFPTYYKKLAVNGVAKLEILLQPVDDTEFKLRANIGVVQINFGADEFISPTYAPADLCLKFLAVNPNRISMFESYPSNWKELINNMKIEDDGE
ncbi:hypothetical protein LZZ90_08290 [Flavobacterium sp. SM15]|uniref:hypothetical protein n=1 Tax=Flavobacterium sp. SM15 TaxID=2908005 RepID=UPI001EDBD6E8|nr:hypothetical protein [Flavobacterium sp. SM15]MCG2611505.1 hypothetical protein [Flavobacterium sp. SM15]